MTVIPSFAPSSAARTGAQPGRLRKTGPSGSAADLDMAHAATIVSRRAITVMIKLKMMTAMTGVMLKGVVRSLGLPAAGAAVTTTTHATIVTAAAALATGTTRAAGAMPCHHLPP